MPKRLRTRAALMPALIALAALQFLAAPAVAAPPAGGWQPTAPTSAGHDGSAVAVLPGGDVLVIGGSSGSGPTATVERYHVASATWSTVAPLATPRSAPTATTLADGRVLVAGGFVTAGTTATSEIYDPAADAWTPAASMSDARSQHTATLLPDGRVLAAGGGGVGLSVLASAELYDPQTGGWTPAGTMASPHALHTATPMPDGSVVVVGGAVMLGPPSAGAGVDRFDPATGSWTALPSLPQSRMSHATVLLPDGALLVVGGNGGSALSRPTVRLDPGAGSWQTIGDVLAYDSPAALLLPNGLVLVATGSASSLIDPSSGDVGSAGTLRSLRLGGALVALPGGDVLSVGGSGSGTGVDRFTPVAAVASAPVDFGDVTAGRRSAAVPVPLVTAGDVPLFLRSLTIEGPDAGDFQLVADSCSGSVLASGEICFVTVRFTPSAAGDRSAALVIGSPTLPDGRQQLSLTGTAQAEPSPPAPPVPPVPGPTPAAPGPAPAAPAPAAGNGGRPAARSARPSAPAAPRIRCSARRGRHVVCSGIPPSLGRGRVRLSRAGIVHATGTLRGGRLTLTIRRRLFDRRYTLVVGGRRAVEVVID